MAARVTQNATEVLAKADNQKARVTQLATEVLELPTTAVARVTQLVTEALELPTVAKVRVTQCVVEVIHTGGCESITGCPTTWTPPVVAAYPVPSAGGPLYVNFDEKGPNWGEFGQQFPDLNPSFDTLQSARIRRFIFQYDGLSEADVDVIEDHYESTRGGLSFTLTHPRTAEVITKVRYARRPDTDHRRSWSRAFTVELWKYSN